MAKIPQKIQIIPLGGLGEAGKNMTVIRYGDEMVVIDCGLMFPGEDMPGIDLVIPDVSYLVEHSHLIKAIVLTHGHEDHIGALPYILQQINISTPIYGTKLTLGILEARLKERGITTASLNIITSGATVKAGYFKLGFFHVSHSIADSVGVSVRTPAGLVVHTGDFKMDPTPVDGRATDLYKMAQLGKQGVLVLLADSTNAEQTGYTPSERSVWHNLDESFHKADQRILIATFSSNIHRIQQVFDAACLHRRKVAILGRNMLHVVHIALQLGYLNIPDNCLISIDQVNQHAASEVVILITGNHGEPVSALAKIAAGDHRRLAITPGDVVIISATVIPGHEKSLSRTVDALLRQGAEVVYHKSAGMNVSGHASQEELKLVHHLLKPKFFVPVHGEYRHLKQHAALAQQLGMPKENILVAENGWVLEFSRQKAGLAGKVTAGDVLVDGLGVGDVGNIVLRDRRQLSHDGILMVVVALDKAVRSIVAGPEIISRGFVYVRESEALIEEARERVRKALEQCVANNVHDWAAIKASIRDALSRFLYEQTRRRPMILPIITEV